MKNCRKYNNKIIFFDDLDAAEQQIIREHLGECEDCQAYFNKVMAISTSLRNESSQRHLNSEMLTRFIIGENFPGEPDFDGKELSSDEVIAVRAHLNICDTCKTQYEEMNDEFNSIETYLTEAEIPDLILGKDRISTIMDSILSYGKSIKMFLIELQTRSKKKYVLIPAVGLSLLLVLLLMLPLIKGGGNIYDRLGQLEEMQISYLTRGAGIDLLQSGVAEFNRSNYAASVEMLEQFSAERAGDPNRDFAEYVCGLAYIFRANNASEEAIQRQYIDKGIEHLQNVVLSSSNLRFQEGANWFIGKGYLMLEDGQTALKYFKRVQDLNGRKAQKARNIVTELEKNLISTK